MSPRQYVIEGWEKRKSDHNLKIEILNCVRETYTQVIHKIKGGIFTASLHYLGGSISVVTYTCITLHNIPTIEIEQF